MWAQLDFSRAGNSFPASAIPAHWRRDEPINLFSLQQKATATNTVALWTVLDEIRTAFPMIFEKNHLLGVMSHVKITLENDNSDICNRPLIPMLPITAGVPNFILTIFVLKEDKVTISWIKTNEEL
jgi:hypothetical protein